ncbi:MAG: sensor histidine kinase [Paludibacter sp.]|nr:sensor histidine kinase [Paludibacter sp.]
MTQTRYKNLFQFLIHFIVWGFVFCLPFIIFWRDSDYNIWDKMIPHMVVISSMMLIFYLNYFLLIEKKLFQRKTGKFLLYNLLLVVITGASVHYLQTIIAPPMPKMQDKPNLDTFFLIRDIITLAVVAVLSVAIKMTGKWYITEAERQEEEKERTEAELKNLRQQLNPHFLFNTLNNIYALIAISPEKAQESMLELSKLLRYVLYENNGNFVPVERELNFIHNYVELMRIRLTPDVDVKIDINVAEISKTVAPLLFITLIENAFKHGVSPTHASFIYININQDNNKQLSCTIRNSYFPKDDSDQSGSGIGLENLRRRLEILYPHKHILRTEKEGASYIAELILPLHQINEL